MTPLKEEWSKKSPRRSGQRDTCSKHLFIIITNTKETENNYLDGLKRSLPKNQKRVVINDPIYENNPQQFVERILKHINTKVSPSSGVVHKWIFFDHDQLLCFDKIIQDAESKGIEVAWSNPCLEVWFLAYFGTVPSVGVDDSTECIKQFKNVFCRETKMEYEKSDKDIYKHLCEHGNEENAFNWARTKRKEFQKKSDESKKKLPYSEWIPSTTVDKLVKEIQELVKVVEEHASK